MSVTIKEVKSRRDLLKFIDFPEKLYRKNPYYTPPLVFDQIDTLDPKRNPASSFSESALYLAYKDGELAGRVAAIVNKKANEQWNHAQVRFGWYDFIDDKEVSQALMAKVEEFGRERGMKEVVGPLGFTDFDPEGMLVEGFEYDNNMPMIYNAPYYQGHVEAMGFTKDADWLEARLIVPKEMPERIVRMAKVVEERSKVHAVPLSRRKIKQGKYGRKIFNLINECYKVLYNYTVMPEDLADKYLDFYLSVLDLRYVAMIENEKGELIAFGITMPSLTGILKKCRGHLFPFGWAMLLWRLFVKHSEGLELLLVGIRPDYRNCGINVLLFNELLKTYTKLGLKWAETNAMLENNFNIQEMFADYEHTNPRRRRSYIKTLK